MGYDDGAGDFTFAASLDKAVEIGMMTRASADCILQKQYALYRRDLVDLSVSALTTPLADGSATLAESLAKKGVFTWEEGRAQGLIGGGQESYVHSSLRNTGAPKPEQSASSGAVSRVTKTYALPSGSVSADVITVDTSAPRRQRPGRHGEPEAGRFRAFQQHRVRFRRGCDRQREFLCRLFRAG